jgi:hypothetical protein
MRINSTPLARFSARAQWCVQMQVDAVFVREDEWGAQQTHIAAETDRGAARTVGDGNINISATISLTLPL